jgi:signal transduction histidine kinase
MADPVLLVDDGEKLSAMLRTYLGQNGFDVDCRPDVASGLKADREKIFEPFYRMAAVAENAKGGIGLGLALALFGAGVVR